MTDLSNEELQNKLDDIDARITEIEILLLGDRKQRQIYKTAKKGHVTPNVVEPPPGALEVINKTLDSLNGSVAGFYEQLDKRFEIVTKLSAFFGPMLAGKNPPLDGNLIASKEYVDDGIARFARAIRDEVSQAKTLTGELLSIFRSAAQDVDDRRRRLVAAITHLITREQERELAEKARRERPSRVQSLIYAVTGQPPKNGAER